MFLCELSMTLCLVYKTKYSEQSSDTIRDAIKNKLSICSLHWDPSDIYTKMRTSGLNQMRQRKCSFTPFVLLTDASAWKRGYTVSSVDKIAAVIVISICFWCDATFTFIVIECQTLKRVNASGRGLWWEDDNLSMSCSGGSVYANVFLGWRSLALQIQNEPFLELD